MLRPKPTLDEIFRVLADPTRRAILERLARGPAATSALAKDFDMALPSFDQHLAMLERCGLLRSMKLGRTRMYRLTPRPLKLAHAWLARQRRASAACGRRKGD